MLTAQKSTRFGSQILVIICLLLSGWMVSAGGAKSVGEYQVKAVFLYNFTKFVNWPTNADTSTNTPFVIGIVGEDPFGTTLDDAVRGEQMQNRPIVIRRFRSDEAIGNCQVLFIARSEKDRLGEVLEQMKGRATLIVADTVRAAEHGCMINLLLAQGSVKMEINQSLVEAAGLQVSSKLLSLARIVNTEAPKPAPNP